MYVITLIGATGQGKSPFIRNYISGKKCFVFDVQNEYGARTKYPGQKPVNLSNNVADPRSRFIIADTHEFIKLCAQKKNTICVFEEATMFFEGRTAEDMRRLIFSKFHSGNNYILVFHSINSVPPRLFEATDYIVLFKTGDDMNRVKAKYSKLVPYFTTLNNKRNGMYVKIKNI